MYYKDCYFSHFKIVSNLNHHEIVIFVDKLKIIIMNHKYLESKYIHPYIPRFIGYNLACFHFQTNYYLNYC
jgi:hypothetical protein